MAIGFTLSDGQQELQKNAQTFAEAVLRPTVERIDRAGEPWEAFLAGREAYREMAKACGVPEVGPGSLTSGDRGSDMIPACRCVCCT